MTSLLRDWGRRLLGWWRRLHFDPFPQLPPPQPPLTWWTIGLGPPAAVPVDPEEEIGFDHPLARHAIVVWLFATEEGLELAREIWQRIGEEIRERENQPSEPGTVIPFPKGESEDA